MRSKKEIKQYGKHCNYYRGWFRSSYEYVQEYIDRYNLHTWKVYRNKENKGYSLNFSNAIDAAKGELIFLCDQDDIWHSDKIEKMSKIMEENSQIELLACISFCFR